MPDNFTIAGDNVGMRIDRWFGRQYKGAPFSLFAKLQRKKNIKVNGKRVDKTYVLAAGDQVKIYTDFAAAPDNQEYKKKHVVTQKEMADFKKLIIFENADFIVINKPHGLASQGGSGITISVDDIIQAISERYKLVHRLDKDTSGCLAIAKKTTAAAKFAEMLQAGEIEKKYKAWVRGVPSKKHGFIDFPLLKKGGKIERMQIDPEGKIAKSEYSVLRKIGNEFALVELEPHTGRTHQLRVHMAAIDCPIMGDGKYGGTESFDDRFSKKLHLHAFSLECPALGISASAPLPEHMQRIVDEVS